MKNKDIIEKVSKEFGVDIKKRSRARIYVYGRTVYYKIARDMFNRTLSSIGKDVGTDHATVLHAIRNVFPTIVRFEPDVVKSYNRLCKEIDFEKGQIETIPASHEEAKREVANLRYRLKLVEEENRRLVKVGNFEDLITRIPEDKVELVRLRLDAIIKML